MAKENQEESKLNKLMSMVETLVSKVSNLESENEQLKKQVLQTKGKKFKITGQGNSVDSEWKEGLDERNRQAEENPTPVHLQKEVGFKGLVDACPYCNSIDRESLLDLSLKTGRYQCRACAKTWDKRIVNLPYSEHMETGQFDEKELKEYVKLHKQPVAA